MTRWQAFNDDELRDIGTAIEAAYQEGSGVPDALWNELVDEFHRRGLNGVYPWHGYEYELKRTDA